MSSFMDRFKKMWKNFPGLKELDPDVRKIVFGIIFCLLMLVILTANMIPTTTEFRAGEAAPADITAPQDLEIFDEESTQIRRQLARENLPAIYREDRKAFERSNNIFRQALEAAGEYDGENRELELEGRLNELEVSLTQHEIDLLINFDADELSRLRDIGEEALEYLFRGPVREDEINAAEEDLKVFLEEVHEEEIDEEKHALLVSLIMSGLSPNMVLDEEATEALQQDVLAEVEPVYVTFNEGDLVVREGETITPLQLRVLEELGLTPSEVGWLQLTGTVIYFLILTMITVYYLKNHLSSVWENNNRLYLLQSLVLILFLVAWALTFFDFEYVYYLIPVGMLSILTTILLSTPPAVIVTIYASLLLPLLFGLNFDLAIAAFVSGMVGCYSVAEINQRSDLVRAGFNISGVLIFTIIMINFLQPAFTLLDMAILAGLGALNGLLVAIFSNGLLPYLENLFNLTSAVKLLELSNPNSPLLKKLLVEAPGTYHHSMVVGNLAETAADNIGADALLTRVGAYYHDIGKIKRPYFFTDNQFSGENPHEDIKPNLSSLIIKSHVKDGVKMAREHDLPAEVIDLIEQHQGTNLISYFYQEAIHNDDHTVAEESDFRYDGPKPQSKEAAILMLADIVEATIRSKNFDKTNPNRIENMVRGLVREKLLENQLDESDLTLKELNDIADSFSKILTGIYHQRVEYPDDLEEELEEMEGYENAGSEDEQ